MGQALYKSLGAFMVQKNLDIPSIGGKDSMSGSLRYKCTAITICFAVSYDKVDNIISKELKSPIQILY